MANNFGIPVNTPAGSLPSIAAAWRATKDLVPYPASSIKLVRNRLDRGWTLDQALGFTKPQRRGRPTNKRLKPIMVAGVMYPSRQAAAEALGVDYATVRQRLSRGWTIEEAFDLVERGASPMACPGEEELAKHGLTKDDWANLWLAQGGACLLCDTKESTQWHIDDDNILCDNCYRAVSYFRKDDTTLNGFLAYVNKHYKS